VGNKGIEKIVRPDKKNGRQHGLQKKKNQPITAHWQ